MKQMDRVVFLSRMKDKNRLLDTYLATKKNLDNITYISNGGYRLPDDVVRGEFRRKHTVTTTFLALCVSNFDRLKNQEFVLRAFLHSNCQDATLVLIGSVQTSYSQYLQSLIAKYNCSSRVQVLCGLAQDEIISAYADSDLFVLGSNSEAQPLVLLDAMAAGVPFLSTPVGAIRELNGGITCDSWQDMGKKMRLLFEDEWLRGELSRRGNEQASARYTWESVIGKYEQLIREV